MLKRLEGLKYTPLYEIILPVLHRLEIYSWQIRKKHPPVPQLIKHKIIRDLADKYSIKTLVETGTYLGNMINTNKNYFEKIFTIELNKKLYWRAKRKFVKYKHIIVKQGDSARLLPYILKMIQNPVIFWLDAHYSGGITSRGKIETPIISELKTILKNPLLYNILLIDDALCFNGQNGYPTIEIIKEIILKKNNNYNISVKNNIIHIIPHKPL